MSGFGVQGSFELSVKFKGKMDFTLQIKLKFFIDAKGDAHVLCILSVMLDYFLRLHTDSKERFTPKGKPTCSTT